MENSKETEMNKSIAARNVENNQENFSILFQNCPFFPWKKLCNIQHFEFFHLFNLFDFEFVGFQTKWIYDPLDYVQQCHDNCFHVFCKFGLMTINVLCYK